MNDEVAHLRPMHIDARPLCTEQASSKEHPNVVRPSMASASSDSPRCQGTMHDMHQKTEVVVELPVRPVEGATYSFARLSRQDVTYGSHGLHKYPAKFIPQFPRWGLSYDPDTPSETVLDPFCGSGTTLVEAGIRGSHAIGGDISPLAVLITSAKCVTEADKWDTTEFLKKVVSKAKKIAPSLTNDLKNGKGETILGMHYTWANWFNAEQLGPLIGLRDTIREAKFSSEQRLFALAVLSSVVKACSFLNEDQIKVRFDHDKKPADPYEAFSEAYAVGVTSQSSLSEKYLDTRAKFSVYQTSAEAIPVADGSIDRIITSPPYINAVDYTMAHKYNLFALGLLEPDDFKNHCRKYIGVTERAVRTADLGSMPSVGNEMVQDAVQTLLLQDTPTARNRAYVVAQYFDGMAKSFREAFRTLRAGGLYVLVVGESNRICGLTIPTAKILAQLAETEGFATELSFFHLLANRSSMRLSRSETGGTINREHVYVFRK